MLCIVLTVGNRAFWRCKFNAPLELDFVFKLVLRWGCCFSIGLQVKGGVADADGRLCPGDQILAVNGDDMRTATQDYAAQLLKAI